MFTLVLIILAARLLADLTSLRLVPAFRVYLFALIVTLLFQWYFPANAWFSIALLVIKSGATIEAIKLTKRQHIWLFAGGVAVAGACVVLGFQQQFNLLSPGVIYVKHITQVALAVGMLAVALFNWIWEDEQGSVISRHRWLMTALWFDYAIIGLIAPSTNTEWVLLNTSWTVVACILMALWVRLISATPPGSRLAARAA